MPAEVRRERTGRPGAAVRARSLLSRERRRGKAPIGSSPRSLSRSVFPLRDHVVLVSGRASFELAQKSVMAGVPICAPVSAPSSLAVEVASEFNMTLVSFLRDERFNVYAGAARMSSLGLLRQRLSYEVDEKVDLLEKDAAEVQ